MLRLKFGDTCLLILHFRLVRLFQLEDVIKFRQALADLATAFLERTLGEAWREFFNRTTTAGELLRWSYNVGALPSLRGN